MDCGKTGELILRLRKEKNMTQKELADLMNISDKAVSKWERGMGCPDVSLLGVLSEVLGVNIEKLLEGELEENKAVGGNMKKTKFYVCPVCGNVIVSIGNGDCSCCGRRLEAMRKNDKQMKINVENVDGEYFVSMDHEMTKEHYISFVAWLSWDRIFLVKLYPEQTAEARLPKVRNGGKIIAGCIKHGLIEINL